MPPLEPPEIHYLRAAQGWLELGNPEEAELELARIPKTEHLHPEVLSVYWQLFAARRVWEEALSVAKVLVQVSPESPRGWIHQSYALHELNRTQEAWDTLAAVAHRFREEGVIPYNLACYACKMGNRTEALRLLEVAMGIDGKERIKPRALEDLDLKELWDEIQEL